MAEQRPGEQPDEPGREVARAQPSQPELDAEQLRQFRQFQQFQDFLRFSEAQGQDGKHEQPATGGQLVPGQGAPPAPPPGGSLQVAAPPHLPAPRPKIRAPRWAKRLAGKLLSALLFFLVLAIAGKLAYDHFFPSNDDNRPASETGGGTYHANKILSTQPYEAVRTVYDAIAQKDPNPEDMVARACGRFREDIQQKFAVDLGFADCHAAVLALHEQVTNVNSYAESIPSYRSGQPTDSVRIDSCSFSISGGPALGVFTVTKVEKSQWLITGHEPGPPTCAGTSAKTVPTTP
ncbi:hypothetical protein [Amycolatopsis taiwanensis]|uniref:Uncharacterized protein n=1 Tax=Amycolatopsis taiwanensis TaxID=342230 RepID=A0A9W6QT67_9PSEU|nr:hypothetical protein [Amycolatopsis taiwanensis]GLY63581.1 hypothetical protein Atai01_02000 [Amycolatopsis taiwanensis]